MSLHRLSENNAAQKENFHAGSMQMAEKANSGSNFHAGENFHAGSAMEVLGTSNFHAGQNNFHAGRNSHAGSTSGALGSSNFHAGNFHAGSLNGALGKSNFHAGDDLHTDISKKEANLASSTTDMLAASNFSAGNFHADNFHAGENFHACISTKETNFHAGENFHAGHNFHAGNNFHAGSTHKVSETSNFHAGDNFHAGSPIEVSEASNFHAGNFHAGENFHAGTSREGSNSHANPAIEVPVASNFHAGNFHAGTPREDANFHAGENFHVGKNFHAGTSRTFNFHTGCKSDSCNFHAGGSHDTRNFHAGNTERTNFLADDTSKDLNFHAGQKSRPEKRKSVASQQQDDFNASEIINFHAGLPSASTSHQRNTSRSQQEKAIETSLSFYSSTFDGKAGFNHVERPIDGVYSNVTTSSHKVSVMDVRGSENHLDIDRDAVLCISNIRDQKHTFTDDAEVVRDFYPEVEELLIRNVPGAQRIFLFDHTIRRKFGDRGPVLRAHIDQTPESALARISRHLPDEFESLANGRVRLINFWRPINGTVENYPLAFALSDSVADGDLEPVKHHYPTWTGETYGVRYSEQQKWCYWSGMGNEDALLLQCFDSEKGGRLVHSAILDPTSASTKYRESIEVRALVFG